MSLPNPGLSITPENTALVVIDPQNDFLSPNGVAWGVVGQSVTENRTVENLLSLFRAALDVDMQVFVSPHYYYPHDHQWRFEGALEKLMHNINMFDRRGPLDLKGLVDSGADWLEQFKPYIDDGKAVVVSPHKVFGPETNDLVLQLRKRNINKVLLAGMSATHTVPSSATSASWAPPLTPLDPSRSYRCRDVGPTLGSYEKTAVHVGNQSNPRWSATMSCTRTVPVSFG